jgi:N6-adenosine-specific RNA methylase IME4
MTALAKYDAACAALAAAVTADEVMTVRLEAKAIAAVARVANNIDLEISATKLRVRAETKLGAMLAEGERNGIVAGQGRQPKRENKGSETEPLPATLEEMGIDKKLSARSRRLNDLGQPAVDAMLDRFETESRANGKPALDILAAQERDALQQRRRDMEQELSDASAQLEGGRRFPNIYADPATKFLSGFGDRSIENHYVTMTTEKLCALPIKDRALTPARLFIWSTVPQLANTFLIAAAWGFPDYSSHMIWDKTSPDHPDHGGTGHVFINQHELLLYFKRGNPAGPTRGTQALSIYREAKTEHSRKPDYFRTMINEFTGSQDVLELFARVDADHPLPPNFTPWGNQT